MQERGEREPDGAPPTIWASTKAGTDAGWIPAKVSVRARPTVTAGLANACWT